MDARVGLGVEDGAADSLRIEQVEGDGCRAHRPHPVGIPGRVVRPDDLVAALHQLRDEPATDGATGTSYEDSHRVLLSGDLRVTSAGSGGSTDMTPHDGGM